MIIYNIYLYCIIASVNVNPAALQVDPRISGGEIICLLESTPLHNNSLSESSICNVRMMSE